MMSLCVLSISLERVTSRTLDYQVPTIQPIISNLTVIVSVYTQFHKAGVQLNESMSPLPLIRVVPALVVVNTDRSLRQIGRYSTRMRKLASRSLSSTQPSTPPSASALRVVFAIARISVSVVSAEGVSPPPLARAG